MKFEPVDHFTEDDWNDILGLPSEAIQKQLDAKLDECISIIEKATGKTLTKPTLNYKLKGHTAGRALLQENIIQLNLQPLTDSRYMEDMIENTLPHELAHIAEYQLYGTAGHKLPWARLMRTLGIAPTRCHQYETTAARNRKKLPRPHIYYCDCRTHQLTDILHNRIRKGRTYTCTNCKGRLYQ